MAKRILSVPEKFKKFVDNLQIDNESVINRRFKAIAQKVNLDYRNIRYDYGNAHFIGSYGRGTAIKGTGIFNVMVLLQPNHFKRIDTYDGNGQLYLLRELKEKVAEIYPETIIKDQEKGEVVIPFQDGMTIEVIPAFTNSRGNYLYPNISDGGSWNEFNPIKEIETINSLNYMYAGKIKHLARMMRAWQHANNVALPGMLLDNMAMNFMEEWEGKDRSYLFYGSMILAFFEYLAGKRDDQEHWYARGSNRELPRTGLFGDMANTAFKETVEVLKYEEERDYIRADAGWKKIFGDYFPA
ncbi:hypothetical protein ASZ90_018703 [hydrocarbon metagenome]|uniref:Nucleotidyltransferase n=1 Tax=hydrocarbon metagenome TaxID=938273 RepID=A0A0W8E6D2_9ZZZZ